MENNNKMRELYELYLELGHEVFEEEIKKPMELYYLHKTHDSSNVTTMSSLNTFDANDMQSHKLGDATFDEDDLFSPPSFDEETYFDDTLPPIYDDYCDDTYAKRINFCKWIMIIMIHMIATLLSLLPLLLMILLMWGVKKILCFWIMIRKFYVILILLSLFMIPLKIIMRGEHMLIDISIISSSLSS